MLFAIAFGLAALACWCAGAKGAQRLQRRFSDLPSVLVPVFVMCAVLLVETADAALLASTYTAVCLTLVWMALNGAVLAFIAPDINSDQEDSPVVKQASLGWFANTMLTVVVLLVLPAELHSFEAADKFWVLFWPAFLASVFHFALACAIQDWRYRIKRKRSAE